MTEEEYAKKTDSVRAFKQRNKMGRFNPEFGWLSFSSMFFSLPLDFRHLFVSSGEVGAAGHGCRFGEDAEGSGPCSEPLSMRIDRGPGSHRASLCFASYSTRSGEAGRSRCSQRQRRRGRGETYLQGTTVNAPAARDRVPIVILLDS